MAESGKPRSPKRTAGSRSLGRKPAPGRTSSQGARTDRSGAPKRDRAGRDRAMEGGFGPHGAPTVPDRARREDEPDRERRPAPLRLRGAKAEAIPERRPAAGRTRTQGKATQGKATQGKATLGKATQGKAGAAPSGTRRRRGRPPTDVETEVLRLGGRRGPFLLREVMAAAEAYGDDRDREALRYLRPVRDAIPDAPSVRELTGLAHYRIGNYRAAATELEAFVSLADSVEQHPVLMDCYRAQRRWRRVDELWEELAVASPSAELVTEGRIVVAGALADRRLLAEAIAVLDKKAGAVRNPQTYHLRLWYSLADLEERAGNNARARALFDRIAAHDRDFADVARRRASLR